MVSAPKGRFKKIKALKWIPKAGKIKKNVGFLILPSALITINTPSHTPINHIWGMVNFYRSAVFKCD